MEVLILTTSHFKSSGHNHLQDIRPYLGKLGSASVASVNYMITYRSPDPLRSTAHPLQIFTKSVIELQKTT